MLFSSEREFKKALRDTLTNCGKLWKNCNIPLFRYFYNHLSNYTNLTIIRLRLVNIGEYSPRLRLGKYSPIFTSPSVNNC